MALPCNDSGKMDANLTATELMKKMGQGWNLGNTLEACGSAKETQGFTPEDFVLNILAESTYYTDNDGWNPQLWYQFSAYPDSLVKHDVR